MVPQLWGSNIPQEAKQCIFKGCLGFSDFSNFNDARFVAVHFEGKIKSIIKETETDDSVYS
jgi:hypothetical protein